MGTVFAGFRGAHRHNVSTALPLAIRTRGRVRVGFGIPDETRHSTKGFVPNTSLEVGCGEGTRDRSPHEFQEPGKGRTVPPQVKVVERTPGPKPARCSSVPGQASRNRHHSSVKTQFLFTPPLIYMNPHRLTFGIHMYPNPGTLPLYGWTCRVFDFFRKIPNFTFRPETNPTPIFSTSNRSREWKERIELRRERALDSSETSG